LPMICRPFALAAQSLVNGLLLPFRSGSPRRVQSTAKREQKVIQ
jgi:hypothetical protein